MNESRWTDIDMFDGSVFCILSSSSSSPSNLSMIQKHLLQIRMLIFKTTTICHSSNQKDSNEAWLLVAKAESSEDGNTWNWSAPHSIYLLDPTSMYWVLPTCWHKAQSWRGTQWGGTVLISKHITNVCPTLSTYKPLYKSYKSVPDFKGSTASQRRK